MEYFDVLDQNRNFVGKIYPRGTKLEENEFNSGVEIYITSHNHLLLSQRCHLKSHPLEWESQGGCVIAGDDSLKTVYKEVEEEIGLKLEKMPIYLDTQIYKNQFVDIYTINLDDMITDFTLQKEEVNDIKWVSEQEFLDMVQNNQIVASVLSRYSLVKDKLNLNWKS